MSAFRGFLNQGSFSSSIEPHFSDSGYSVSDVVLPSSCQYNLQDLLSSGVKLSPVDSSILHDEDAIGDLMAYDEATLNVEPSNE